MKYLNTFENKSLYNDYINRTGIAPHVGYITDINEVKYKKLIKRIATFNVTDDTNKILLNNCANVTNIKINGVPTLPNENNQIVVQENGTYVVELDFIGKTVDFNLFSNIIEDDPFETGDIFECVDIYSDIATSLISLNSSFFDEMISLPQIMNTRENNEIFVPDSITEIPAGWNSYHFGSWRGTENAKLHIGKNVNKFGKLLFVRGKVDVYIDNIKHWLTIDGVDNIKGHYGGDGIQQLFVNNELITDLVIPEGVTEIRGGLGLSQFTSITIPDFVTGIEDDQIATSLCTLDSSIYYCGNHIIQALTDVTSVNIPSNIKCIAGGAFSNCRSLTSINIPETQTFIGNNTFAMCSGLTSITIPDSVTSIGDYAFYACRSLTSITIPDSVTSIGSSAFKESPNLRSVTIGNGITSIGDQAFYQCNSLNEVICLATIAPELGKLVFTRSYATPGVIKVPIGSDYSSWTSKLPSNWTIEYI